MKFLYASINDLNDKDIVSYTDLLPEIMQLYINKFVNESDRKHRLLARLMLRHCLMQTTGSDILLNTWQLDANNKPFIEKWNNFNMAHSGEFVVFVYDEQCVGVDVEKIDDFDYSSVTDYLHFEERTRIANSADKQTEFYAIWAKKESMLKAIGVGIVNGVEEFSCIGKSAFYDNQEWFFHPIVISPTYACYVSAKNSDVTWTVERFRQ